MSDQQQYDQRQYLIKLLRAIAKGTRAQKEQTNYIFDAAADMLEQDGRKLKDATADHQ